MNDAQLREEILRILEAQGFKINPHIRPGGITKEDYRSIQNTARLEQIALHSKFIRSQLQTVESFVRNGEDISPKDISLELKLVESKTLEEKLFRWWNFVWWSIPYQRAYGRQLRLILWDKTHDAPFGLIGLQSPILKIAVRDNHLDIPAASRDIWVNKSMQAQRVGALPPYNDILGGKLVALTLTSNELRNAYKAKYSNAVTIIEKRKIDPDLLFITTSSAFGKSSIYNRLKFRNEVIAEGIGYTKGSGSFHIPEALYQEMLRFLHHKGINISRGYGTGFKSGASRKLKLISHALRLLGLNNFQYHDIKREFFLFPLAQNLKDVIKYNDSPVYFERSFTEIVDFWKERWAIPRASRIDSWKAFSKDAFVRSTKDMLEGIRNRQDATDER